MGTEVLMQICLPGILGDGCLMSSFSLAQHSMDLRAMFAQFVQELGRVLKRAMCSFRDIFKSPTCIYDTPERMMY